MLQRLNMTKAQTSGTELSIYTTTTTRDIIIRNVIIRDIIIAPHTTITTIIINVIDKELRYN
jgi:hypothetical protein